MEKWTLQQIIKYFDYFVKDINYDAMPPRDSEEYRNLLMKTANDVLFSEGRLSNITDFTVDLFSEEEVQGLVHNLTVINNLTDKERQHFKFYMDLMEMCHPLNTRKEIDWSAWPWCMKTPSHGIDNDELFSFIIDCKWPNLSALILFNLSQLMFQNYYVFSPVARQEVANIYGYALEGKWKKEKKTEEENKSFVSAINECANKLWFVNNHIQVGGLLGLDFMAQTVYDAMDTFIDNTYRKSQVLFAREFGAWINDHMTVGELHPKKEKLDAFVEKMNELMEKYHVTSPDLNFSTDYILLDGLGMSMFSAEQEKAMDDCDKKYFADDEGYLAGNEWDIDEGE